MSDTITPWTACTSCEGMLHGQCWLVSLISYDTSPSHSAVITLISNTWMLADRGTEADCPTAHVVTHCEYQHQIKCKKGNVKSGAQILGDSLKTLMFAAVSLDQCAKHLYRKHPPSDEPTLLMFMSSVCDVQYAPGAVLWGSNVIHILVNPLSFQIPASPAYSFRFRTFFNIRASTTGHFNHHQEKHTPNYWVNIIDNCFY